MFLCGGAFVLFYDVLDLQKESMKFMQTFLNNTSVFNKPTNHYKYLIFGFNDVREMVDQFAGFFQLFFGKLRKAFSCDRLFELVNRVLGNKANNKRLI